ncbi:hypothetical protein Peur_030730 [Populus x canadensis]
MMTGVVGAQTCGVSYDCLSSIRHTVHVFLSDSRDIHGVLGSPSEDRNFRSDIVDDTETEEASFSGQEDSSDRIDILEWAKLHFPSGGSTLRFQPLEHLHPLEYHRPDGAVLHINGSTTDLRSCSASLELAEAHHALLAEEEATALSTWAVACICGSMRLEHVKVEICIKFGGLLYVLFPPDTLILTLFAGALLEKQNVVLCSNLGILSASFLSIIPLIRPYRWQSLLMPILPDDMLDFLDAPVPYIVSFIFQPRYPQVLGSYLFGMNYIYCVRSLNLWTRSEESINTAGLL